MAIEDYAAAGLSGERVMELAAKVNMWAYKARDLLSAAEPLIAAGVRAEVAEETAQALRRYQPESARIAVEHGPAMEHAAAIAELHRTPPTDRAEEDAGA